MSYTTTTAAPTLGRARTAAEKPTPMRARASAYIVTQRTTKRHEPERKYWELLMQGVFGRDGVLRYRTTHTSTPTQDNINAQARRLYNAVMGL